MTVHPDTGKIERCELSQRFVAGAATRYCLKPRGHEGACEFQELCSACGGVKLAPNAKDLATKPSQAPS